MTNFVIKNIENSLEALQEALMFTDANNVTELRYVVKNDSKQYVEVIKEDEPNEEIDVSGLRGTRVLSAVAESIGW